jgi:hypothetical protein
MFCLFCMDEIERNETKGSKDPFSNQPSKFRKYLTKCCSFSQILSVFLQHSTILNKIIWYQAWARSLNGDRKPIRYNMRSQYHRFNTKSVNLKDILFQNRYRDYSICLYYKCERSSNRESQIMTIYNLPDNIDLTSICTHKSQNSHNVISKLYHFDYKNIGFMSYIWKLTVANQELTHLTVLF